MISDKGVVPGVYIFTCIRFCSLYINPRISSLCKTSFLGRISNQFGHLNEFYGLFKCKTGLITHLLKH